MWIQRSLAANITTLAQSFPALVLTGARQAGKTSLLRRLFPDHTYVSLDIPSTAALASTSPQEFLTRYPPPLLVDEVQYAPALFRHLKVAIDRQRHTMGQFILTGSQKFTLMQSVADSLAGRCAVVELETLSAAEISTSGIRLTAYDQHIMAITRGTFPELWRDRTIPGTAFYQAYLATYIERDVRQLLNVGSLRDFERFLRACAARSGALLNKSEIARDVGISQPTVGQWLSVLQASNQITLLEPFFANLSKRLVKSPKLYLAEPGLLCFLLGVSPDNWNGSPFVGAIWETFVLAELRKYHQLYHPEATLFFYRDQQNKEVDFLWSRGGNIVLLEAKWTEHPQRADTSALKAVAAVFAKARTAAYRISEALVVCRTLDPFILAPGIRAVNGFHLQEIVAGL